MKSIFLTTLALLFFNISALSQDLITKEIEKAKSNIVDTALATKYIFTSPKKLKK